MTTKEITSQSKALSVSMPRLLLHLEGLAVLVVALAFYGMRGYSWWAFALLLFTPDLAMVFYLIDARVGSVAYNSVHFYAVPLALGGIALATGWGLGLQLALIWLVHIGMDRTLGYGLKYPTEFKDTHFNHI
ncbi:MAG: DUF4260 domain-containing protein [Anaerolineales bacterium]|nr:DUF4260 domain-containing protein [Anaerolineales bacterium]